MGVSATQAYHNIRPDVTNATARVNGPNLVHQPRVQLAIEAARKALVDRATEEFILTRDEILRYHTLTALTPVGEIDESHFLAQEVTFKYATDPTGLPIRDEDGKPLITEKKIKSVSKSDALKEISRLRGDYKPEKLEITDTSTRDKAIDAFSEDPLFAQLLQDEARIQAAKLVRSGAVIEMDVAPPIKTLEDLEEQQRLDDEALEHY